MADDKSGLEALKNLLDAYDYLNDSYNEEFGEDCPYKIDGESENLLRGVVKKIDEENLEK